MRTQSPLKSVVNYFYKELIYSNFQYILTIEAFRFFC